MSEPEHQRPERPRMSTPTFLCWLAIFAGAGYYFYQKLDYVGMLGTAAIGLACFSGFRLGASRITATLLGFAAAVAFAPGLGLTQEHRFTEWFGTTGLTNRFFSIGAIGILLALSVTVVSVLIMNRVMKHRPRLAWSNSWLGFLIGGAEGEDVDRQETVEIGNRAVVGVPAKPPVPGAARHVQLGDPVDVMVLDRALPRREPQLECDLVIDRVAGDRRDDTENEAERHPLPPQQPLNESHESPLLPIPGIRFQESRCAADRVHRER